MSKASFDKLVKENKFGELSVILNEEHNKKLFVKDYIEFKLNHSPVMYLCLIKEDFYLLVHFLDYDFAKYQYFITNKENLKDMFNRNIKITKDKIKHYKKYIKDTEIIKNKIIL